MHRHAILSSALLVLSVSAAAQDWRHVPGFDTVRQGGMAIGDFDGDGSNEVAFTATTSSLDYSGIGAYALAVVQEESGEFRRRGLLLSPSRWTSQPISVPSDGGDRVFSQRPLPDGRGFEFVELTGVPLRPTRTIPSSLEVALAGVADVDSDGALELVGLAGYPWGPRQIAIIDATTGATEWIDSVPAQGLGIAQLDTDPALELIVRREQGVVIDGATRAQEWNYPPGFGGLTVVGRFSDATSIQFASFDAGALTSRLTIFRGGP